jgi:transcriptional accessory protein Tex/SPT6
MGALPQIDILDATRIHFESYNIAFKIACDALGALNSSNPNAASLEEMTDNDKWLAVKAVMRRPEHLNNLKINDYKE